MTKEYEHFTFISLNQIYLFVDHIEAAHKLGYKPKYKGQPGSYMPSPDQLDFYELPDGNKIALDLGWPGHDGGNEIKGVYLVTPETDEDQDIRLERLEAEAQAEKDKKAQELAAKREAKKNELEKARKLVEKAGFTVTK